MSWKKILGGVLAASMIFSASTFCSAAEESANAKLVRIEIDTYGAEQSGALLDRIATLEKSYSGQNMSGNMNARIETTARNPRFWRRLTRWSGMSITKSRAVESI